MIVRRREHLLFVLLAALGLLVAVSAARFAWPSGLRAQYFHGSELAGPPVRTELDAEFSGNQLLKRWRYRPPEQFSAQWSGYLSVDRPGLYTFTVTADDGSRLYVDKRPVIEERGQGPGQRSGQIHLDRGAHAVLLQYFQTGGAFHLEWLWALEGAAPQPIGWWTLSTSVRGVRWALAARALHALWWALIGACAALGLMLVHPFAAALGVRNRDEDVRFLLQPQPWLRHRLPCLALFVALAAAATWPLVTNPAHLSRNDNADTMLNEWTIAWVAHQLPRDPARLFDANIFHPNRDTLAYSEPLIVQSAMGAPLIWLGASPVLVYNILLMAGLALTGWTMALVLARWTGDWVAGVAAGMLMAFNAHTLTRLPHLQAQHVEFLPLALLALDALLRRPRWSSAVWMAGWFVLQALASVYLLVFTLIAMSIAVIARPEDWAGGRFRNVAPKIALAAGVASVALLPLVLPYVRLQSEGFQRSLDEVAWYAASTSDYGSTPSRLHTWLGTSARGGNSFFPGVVALVLAGVAIFWRGEALRNRPIRMCLAFGLAGVLLSFGPLVPGYTFLYSFVPPLQAVRASARFGYLGLVAVAVVAGCGMAVVRQRLAGRPVWQRGLSVLGLIAIFVESFAAPIAYQPFSEIPSIYRLAASEPVAAVAHLPFPPPEAVWRNASYMLASTQHFKPLVNGYSGFTPPSYVAHHAQLAGFPDPASIRSLRALGVSHVFVHVDRMDLVSAEAVTRVTDLRQVASAGSVVLYRLAAIDSPATARDNGALSAGPPRETNPRR